MVSELKKVLITVNQSFSKDVTVLLDKDLSDLKTQFELEHWDIKSLLNELCKYVLWDMDHGMLINKSSRKLEVLYLACKDWIENEYKINIKDEKEI